MDRSYLNRAEMVEGCVAPLYLSVAGTELDRLRIQLVEGTDCAQLRKPEDVVFVIGNDRGRTVHSAPRELLRELPPELADLSGYSKEEVAAEIMEGYTELQGVDTQDEEFSVGLGALMLMCYHLVQKYPSVKVQPNSVQIIACLYYRKMDGRPAILFTVLWRRCTEQGSMV